jgi:hypothetical protein
LIGQNAAAPACHSERVSRSPERSEGEESNTRATEILRYDLFLLRIKVIRIPHGLLRQQRSNILLDEEYYL